MREDPTARRVSDVLVAVDQVEVSLIRDVVVIAKRDEKRHAMRSSGFV